MATTEQGGAEGRRGHGWWPYLTPYMSFMLVVEVAARLPESAAPWILFLQPAIPAALMLHFWRSGAYPELRGFGDRLGGVWLDVALGLGLAAMWMAPFLLFPSLLVFDFMRPDTSVGFDPDVLGESLAPLALSVRMLGYGIVTPFFEELFMRSFVIRYAEVVDGSRDFRDLPVGEFAWRGFIVTLVLFTLTHQVWEYGVMFVWALATNLWLYHRRHLLAVIIAHGATNAGILAFVIQDRGGFLDFEGNPMTLWFFV